MENIMTLVCASCGNTNLTYKDTVEISFEIPYRRRDAKSCILCKNCIKNIENMLHIKVYDINLDAKKETQKTNQQTQEIKNRTSQHAEHTSSVPKQNSSIIKETQKISSDIKESKRVAPTNRSNTPFNRYCSPNSNRKNVETSNGLERQLNRNYYSAPEIHRIEDIKPTHIDKLVHEQNEEHQHNLLNRSSEFENKMRDINSKLLAKEQAEREKERQERIERERQERIRSQEYRKKIEIKLESFKKEDKNSNKDDTKLKLIDKILDVGVKDILTKYCNRDYPLKQLAKDLEFSEYYIRELMRCLEVERYNNLSEQRIIEIEQELSKRDLNLLSKNIKEKKEVHRQLAKGNFDIDKARLNENVVALLEVSEQKIKDTSNRCTRCAYYEKEVGYCWYTMTTGKQRRTIGDRGCSHFVDLESIKDIVTSKGMI